MSSPSCGKRLCHFKLQHIITSSEYAQKRPCGHREISWCVASATSFPFVSSLPVKRGSVTSNPVLPKNWFNWCCTCLRQEPLWIISSVNGCRQASRSLGRLVLSHTPGKTPATCHFPAKPWQISSFTIAHQSVVRSSIKNDRCFPIRLRFEKHEICKHVCASGPNTVLTKRSFCT